MSSRKVVAPKSSSNVVIKPTKRRATPEKAPPMDKLLIPAIVVCLALLVYQFMKGLSIGSIDRIDPTDDFALREVFFAEVTGKQSYVVLCHHDDDDNDSSKKNIPISSVFADAYAEKSTTAIFRLLDCRHVLPDSGKTIAERFQLDLKKRPTIFVSGAVGEPKQIPSKHLKTGKMLTKVLKNMLEPRAAKIETTQDLRVKCLNQPYCAILIKGSKSVDSATKNAIQKLLVEQPRISFASIDASNLYLSNLEEYLPEYQKGRHRFVIFQKVSGSLDTKDSRIITSMAKLDHSGVISYGPMSNLCARVMSGTEPMKRLPALPMIVTRSKKIEAQDQARRQRQYEQEQQQQKQQQQAPPQASSRSKNHQNHHANRRQRTPEEIAEMERQRRIRMEEAEKAWNIEENDEEYHKNRKKNDINENPQEQEQQQRTTSWEDGKDEGSTTTTIESDEDNNDEEEEEFMDLD